METRNEIDEIIEKFKQKIKEINDSFLTYDLSKDAMSIAEVFVDIFKEYKNSQINKSAVPEFILRDWGRKVISTIESTSGYKDTKEKERNKLMITYKLVNKHLSNIRKLIKEKIDSYLQMKTLCREKTDLYLRIDYEVENLVSFLKNLFLNFLDTLKSEEEKNEKENIGGKRNFEDIDEIHGLVETVKKEMCQALTNSLNKGTQQKYGDGDICKVIETLLGKIIEILDDEQLSLFDQNSFFEGLNRAYVLMETVKKEIFQVLVACLNKEGLACEQKHIEKIHYNIEEIGRTIDISLNEITEILGDRPLFDRESLIKDIMDDTKDVNNSIHELSNKVKNIYSNNEKFKENMRSEIKWFKNEVHNMLKELPSLYIVIEEIKNQHKNDMEIAFTKMIECMDDIKKFIYIDPNTNKITDNIIKYCNDFITTEKPKKDKKLEEEIELEQLMAADTEVKLYRPNIVPNTNSVHFVY